MVRRILKIIREEYVSMHRNKQEEVDPQESLHKIVTSEGDVDDYSKPMPDLQESIMEHIGEFEMELETRFEYCDIIFHMLYLKNLA